MDATSNGTANAWRERVVSQQASGQSIRAWCRENDHHEHGVRSANHSVRRTHASRVPLSKLSAIRARPRSRQCVESNDRPSFPLCTFGSRACLTRCVLYKRDSANGPEPIDWVNEASAPAE